MADFYKGDGLCSINVDTPSDNDPEYVLGREIRDLKHMIRDAFDLEHNCIGTHKPNVFATQADIAALNARADSLQTQINAIGNPSLGSATLSAVAPTLSLTIAAKEDLEFTIYVSGTDSNDRTSLQFNDDVGGNYGYDTANFNGNAQNFIVIEDSARKTAKYFTVKVYNLKTQEKLVTGTGVGRKSAALGVEKNGDFGGVWSNIAAQITKVTLINKNGANFNVGTKIIARGY